MGLLCGTDLMQIFPRTAEIRHLSILCFAEADGKGIAAVSAFYQACQPRVLALICIFDLPIARQLLLTKEEGCAIYNAFVVSYGKQMIGNILVFPLVGIPLADQNTAVYAVEILRWICQNCPLGFVEIINGGIRTDISRVFQDRGQLGVIEIHAAGGNGAILYELPLHIRKAGIGQGVQIEDALHNGNLLIWLTDGCLLSVNRGFHKIEPEGSRTAAPGTLFHTGIVVIPHTLRNGFPFQLGEYHDDIQHGASHGSRGIEFFRGGNEGNAVRFQNIDEIRKIQNGAADTV